jgi:hypothetical protein
VAGRIGGEPRAGGEPLVEGILEMGGCYPFFLQMACSAWFEYLEAEGRTAEELAARREAPREVLEVFREEASPHFEYVRETLPERGKAALAAVLRGTRPDSEAAECLARKGYLAAGGEAKAGYQPFSREFGRFLERFGLAEG